ncbi:BRCT domain-containing protein [Mollisia scopiformis]|uniref:BRCT domain-containing protein n=1 Tax=Mollisia scopiformis TaxID=149040 RepID=A0A194XK16_MOLSC|nr:BRCT domain-containing protein [Mollisia scopiformis]KUJ20570.1 BRCT domain-containing protein [Mollisia scopiformis]
MGAPNGPLFEDCVFVFILSRTLPRSLAEESKSIVEENGGEVIPFDEDFDLPEITHIISDTVDFPQYSEARLQLKPVVTVTWITASLNKNKEASIRPFTPDPSMIFANVTITCEGLPTGDKDAIIGAVLAMGGMETSSLTKMTTHICALTVDGQKCQQAIGKRLKCKIVLPHWFDDCMKLGKRIDERPYILPDPEIFRSDPSDPIPMPSTDILSGASSSRPGALPMPTDSPIRKLTVFNNKIVTISGDLDISSRLRKVLEDLIVGGGGFVSKTVHESDMFVCHWREGREYVLASRMGLDVGNLSWLYHLIANNEWISPMRKLLHYPLPKNGIPGFKDFRITLSNYGGEARIYLENLVTAAGAEFTKSMKQDNTHLITARKSSEKCDAAMEWNIEMVNHLWIEESYAKCEVQNLTDPRYTHFPPRTNLGEIIGQTQFDRALLERKYFPRDPTPSPGDPKLVRRNIMREKDRNAPSSRRTDSDADMEDQDEEIRPKADLNKALSRKKSRPSFGQQVSTPASRRISGLSGGKENDTPSTGSRSAKDKANSRIHAAAPDIALYEKEKKRKGGVWGGERAASRIEKEKTLERSSSPANKHDEDDEDLSEDETRTPKRHKSGLPPVQIRLLTTGYKGWLGNLAKEEMDKKKLRDIGILVTTNPVTCTHVAAPAMVRTQKFLCALASGPTILTSDFIDTCIAKGKVPPEKDFLLQDQQNERKFGVKLKDAIGRAKANKRSLLRRVPIYCTADITNGPDTYKDIINANGGSFAIYTGRPFVKKTSPEEDDGPAEPVYLLSGQKPSEKLLWPKFTEMAKEGNMTPRIVDSEWLLDVALSQQNKWNQSYLAERKKG